MKLKNIFFGLLLFVIGFLGCDKITNPIIPQQRNSTLPNTKPDYRDSSAVSGPYSYKQYKLLLEDGMGQRCSNCPSAVAIADTLISPTGNVSYGQVVMLEENFGSFSTPQLVGGYPAYAFTTNYQCGAGNTWCNLFGFGGATAYPVGMINRLGYPSKIDILYTNWQDSISKILTRSTQAVEINIHDSCWAALRLIGVEFQVTFLKTLPAGTYYLEAAIVEDHVISWQEDDLLKIGYDSLYDHRNVLRGSFDGSIGVGKQITNTTKDSTWTSYQTYDFIKGENGAAGGTEAGHGLEWNMANCYIVAFVYNQATYQVIQAEMIKVE